MESRIRHAYDADLALFAPPGGAVVVTTVGSKVDMNRITRSVTPPGATVGALDGRFGEYGFDVVVCLAAGLAIPNSNETYVLDFCTYDSAGANEQVQESFTVVAADVGKPLVFSFDTGTLLEQDADAALFSLKQVLGGTAPSATVWAYIAPKSKH